MRVDEPNAMTEEAELSAAWEYLLAEAEMYAILTVVAAMQAENAVAIYSTFWSRTVADFQEYAYDNFRHRRRFAPHSSHCYYSSSRMSNAVCGSHSFSAGICPMGVAVYV